MEGHELGHRGGVERLQGYLDETGVPGRPLTVVDLARRTVRRSDREEAADPATITDLLHRRLQDPLRRGVEQVRVVDDEEET